MSDRSDQTDGEMRSPANATMAQVAARAGVSTASVSRVLNSPDKVGPALRARVEAAISDLAYVRNGVARALAARSFQTVGAIVPTLGVTTFATGIDALQRRLESKGFSLLLASMHFDLAVEERQVRMLMERGIDGLFLVGQLRRPEIYQLLETAGIPYVCTYTLQSTCQLCVGCDDADGSRRLTRYLIACGHREFGILTSPTKDNDRISGRLGGAVAVIVEAGLPVPEIAEAAYTLADGRSGLRRLMQRRPRTTAVICTTDLHAIGAIAEARALGLKVPERLSVTGFDNLDIVAEIDPPLTTVNIPSREIGERAADLLIARIAGRAVPERIELPATLIVRGSTGAAYTGSKRAR